MKKEISKFIGQTITIKIDRPMNSAHPKHGWTYPINYGFVPDTKNSDGEEIDAYLLGVDNPVDEYTGKCIAIIHRTDDDDDKLIITPSDHPGFTDQEIQDLIHFQEQFFKSEIHR